MKFSLRLNNDLTVADYIRYAQLAEAAGFDQFWVSHDLFLRSAPVILTAVAASTSRIQIGTCILNPYTINPAELAMFAATLDEYSQGRFLLGLGAGAGSFLKWVGLEQSKPLTAIRETITALRALLNGERHPTQGHFLNWTNEAYLRFTPPRRHIPIYLGAMSLNMLRAIGEYADGGLPLLFPPEHYANVHPLIADGAKAAGRDLSEIDIAGCVWCSVSPDREAALDVIKEKIAYYGHALSPLIWSQLGLTAADFAPLEQAMMVENDLAKAKTLVTDAMLRIGIVGTPADLVTRLEGVVSLGVRHLSFGPPLGPNIGNAIQMIGESVLPAFR
jgi:5,10-methylenetetrahydromethanopterin reductase